MEGKFRIWTIWALTFIICALMIAAAFHAY